MPGQGAYGTRYRPSALSQPMLVAIRRMLRTQQQPQGGAHRTQVEEPALQCNGIAHGSRVRRAPGARFLAWVRVFLTALGRAHIVSVVDGRLSTALTDEPVPCLEHLRHGDKGVAL